jgi:hypothetical protein
MVAERKLIPVGVKYIASIHVENEDVRHHTGYMYFIFNVEQTFYSSTNLLAALGLVPYYAVMADPNDVSQIRINNATELCKIGCIGEISCILNAVDPAVTYGNLGEFHKTSFYFSYDKSVLAVAAALKELTINLNGSGILYKVVPNSLKLKKSKKTTPHFG